MFSNEIMKQMLAVKELPKDYVKTIAALADTVSRVNGRLTAGDYVWTAIACGYDMGKKTFVTKKNDKKNIVETGNDKK